MRISLVALLLAISFLASPVHADAPLWDQEFKVGFGGTYKGDVHKSTPIFQSHLKSKQSMYTLLLGYRYLNLKKLYGAVNIDFRGFQDSRHLDGGRLINDGHNVFYDLSAEIGYPFEMGIDWIGAAFVGLGAKSSKLNIQFDLDFVPTNEAYVVRKSTVGMLGFYGRGVLSDSWGLGFKLALLLPLKDPTVTSNLEAAVVGGSVKAKLKKKLNFYADLPITYALEGEQSFLELAPFYESQQMGKPNHELGGKLVDSKLFSTFLIGARFSYLYRF